MYRYRLKALGSWLREAGMLAFAVIYVFFGFAVIYSFGCTEQAIRLVGLLLQLLGISTVIWGITKTRAQFGHSPIHHSVADWFRRCPIVTKAGYIQVDSIQASVSLVGAE